MPVVVVSSSACAASPSLRTSVEQALELADHLSKQSSRAMAATKHLLLDSEGMSPEAGDSMAVDAMLAALASPDGRAGLHAVRNRQTPELDETPPFS